jgi:serine O-acetyltransferase
MNAGNALKGDYERFRARLRGAGPGRWIRAAMTPGTQAILVYRFGSWQLTLPRALRWPLEPLYLIAYLMMQWMWGIQLPRHAKIGPGLYIGHFGGIVVSPHAVLGANCTLMQDVTIGVSGRDANCGVPQIGSDVFIGPGAKLFGRIRVGDNAMIGANTVIYKDVPDNAVVALDPGFRIISFEGNRRTVTAKIAA